jgi:hypothetical protein
MNLAQLKTLFSERGEIKFKLSGHPNTVMVGDRVFGTCGIKTANAYRNWRRGFSKWYKGYLIFVDPDEDDKFAIEGIDLTFKTERDAKIYITSIRK